MPDRASEFASDAVAIDRRRVTCRTQDCDGEAIAPIRLCDACMTRIENTVRPFVAQYVSKRERLLVLCNKCVREDLTLRATGTHYRQGRVPVEACERCGRVFP